VEAITPPVGTVGPGLDKKDNQVSPLPMDDHRSRLAEWMAIEAPTDIPLPTLEQREAFMRRKLGEYVSQGIDPETARIRATNSGLKNRWREVYK
jgi:hypothetical protein